jgi:hypothetical protein
VCQITVSPAPNGARPPKTRLRKVGFPYEVNQQQPDLTLHGWRRRLLRPQVAALAMGVGVLALVAAACGGSPAPSLAGPGATKTSSNSTVAGCSSSGCSNSTASASLEAEALKYAGCMRSHGEPDFPDPTVGSNGLPSFRINGSANLNPQSSQWKAAQQACKTDLPNLGGNTSTDKEAANAKALKYAQCMRSHGEPDFPDPNGQGVIQIPNATGILSPNSPQYQQTTTACQSLDNGFSEEGSARS